MGMTVSPDGAMAIVADTGNHAIRSISVCDNSVCEYGKWRGPCDVTYNGKCVACTKSINSTIMKKATPFNQDACEWECSVGQWQVISGMVAYSCSVLVHSCRLLRRLDNGTQI